MVDDDFTDAAVDCDMATGGVLDAVDRAVDGGVDGAVLEGQIAILAQGAVLHDEVFAIAQGLFAGDVTMDETEVLGVPTEIFTVDFRIVDGNVLGLPECVLGVEHGIVDFHVVTVLEGVVAVLMVAVDADVGGMHEEIVGILDTTIRNADMVAVPERFLGIGENAVAQVDVLHTTKHLRCFHTTVAHRDTTAVPQRRTGTLGKEAVCDPKATALPEDVFSLEPTPFCLDVVGFLDAGFAQVDGDIFQTQVVLAIERTLTTELFILDYFHIIIFYTTNYTN